MATTTTHKLTSSDGLTIHTIAWKITDSKLSVCLVHGLGEHSGRYHHVAKFYNQLGANVYALDLRGHGLSEGREDVVQTLTLS